MGIDGHHHRSSQSQGATRSCERLLASSPYTSKLTTQLGWPADSSVSHRKARWYLRGPCRGRELLDFKKCSSLPLFPMEENNRLLDIAQIYTPKLTVVEARWFAINGRKFILYSSCFDFFRLFRRTTKTDQSSADWLVKHGTAKSADR